MAAKTLNEKFKLIKASAVALRQSHVSIESIQNWVQSQLGLRLFGCLFSGHLLALPAAAGTAAASAASAAASAIVLVFTTAAASAAASAIVIIC